MILAAVLVFGRIVSIAPEADLQAASASVQITRENSTTIGSATNGAAVNLPIETKGGVVFVNVVTGGNNSQHNSFVNAGRAP